MLAKGKYFAMFGCLTDLQYLSTNISRQQYLATIQGLKKTLDIFLLLYAVRVWWRVQILG